MRYLPLILLPLLACGGSSDDETLGSASIDETSGAEIAESRAEERRPQLSGLPITAHLISGLDYLYVNVERLRRSPTLNELIDEFLDSLGSTDAELTPILRGLREGVVLLSVEEIVNGPGIYDRSRYAGEAPHHESEIKRVVLYGEFSAVPQLEHVSDEFTVSHQSAEAILLDHDGKLDPSAQGTKFERAIEARVGITDSIRGAAEDAPEAIRALLRDGEEFRLSIDISDPIVVSGSLRYRDESAAKGAVDALSWHLRKLEALALMLPAELRVIINNIILRQDGVHAAVELRVPEATFSSLGTLIEDVFSSIGD